MKANESVYLRPCPFCGGKAIAKQAVTRITCTNLVYIMCRTCYAKGKTYYSEDGDSSRAKPGMRPFDSAVMAWNSRYDDELLTNQEAPEAQSQYSNKLTM